MTLYRHYTDFHLWETTRWPNFTPKELSCKCCGEYYHDPSSLDKLQKLRTIINKPIILNSAHRCVDHNAKQPGASKNSRHLKIAFDISLNNHNPISVLTTALLVEFKAYGIYRSFLHLDNRPTKTNWPIIMWKG
jgi:zinc D-Ala-D-Ala carboxypeptidase